MKLGYVLLYVEDVEVTMSFYEKAFGLQKGFLHEEKDYGEMLTGETKLGFVRHGLAETHGFSYEKTNLQKNPPSNEIALVTSAVEEAYSQSIANGAVSLCRPIKKPWGQTVAYVRDLNGFIVEIASPIGS